MRYVWLLAALILAPQAFADDCDPVDGITSICGLQKPEDIERVPDSPFLVFSQLLPGEGLWLLDTRDDEVRGLYPWGAEAPEPGWGDPSCQAGPGEQIEAHGIHLRQRKDGRTQVLVVNHGGRESVEYFELLEIVEGLPAAIWRGCVEATGDQYFNDVVGLPDGGFLVTHMVSRDAPMWGSFKAVFGDRSGRVDRWRPGSGFETVPGTEVQFANGIALDPDDQHFYLNAYFGNEVSKFRLDGGEPLWRESVLRPDNSAWDLRGQLLLASHDDSLAALLDGMSGGENAPVDMRFRILALDPDTGAQRVLLEREGAPMGGGTVAVEAAGHLYIGSFAGDRIIKFPLTLDR